MLPLRPPQEQGWRLARRARLPGLRGPRPADRGACPGCGEERAFPGRRPGDGAATCTSCAGFSQSFACARCGLEGKLHGGRLCTRCTFADRLAGLLDDGRVRPGLVPLADALLAMDNPLSGLTWLCPRSGRAGSADDLLRRLARGEVELTHEAFNGLQPWRAASHLRDLLMSCGVLPAVDKQVCAFERWLGVHLATVADDGHAQVLRRFAAWEVLPGLRARAEKKPLNSNARGYAAAQIRRASDFLRWLMEMPAPVVADALSYSQGTTARLTARAGGTFSRYAPGGHLRPAPGQGE